MSLPPDRPEQSAPIERGNLNSSLLAKLIGRVQSSRVSAYLLVSDGIAEKCIFFPIGGIRMSSLGKRRGRTLRKVLEAHPDFDSRLLEGAATESSVEGLLDGADRKVVHACSSEVVRDELLDLIVWDGAEYEFRESNPPARLFDPDIEAVKMSLGVPKLLEELQELIQRWDKKHARKLGQPSKRQLTPGPKLGSFSPGGRVERAVLSTVAQEDRCTLTDAILSGRRSGKDPLAVCEVIERMVDGQVLRLEPKPKQTEEERRKAAMTDCQLIEAAIQKMINQLIARKRLAAGYAEVGEVEKAVENYRLVGEELVARGEEKEAIGIYRAVIGIQPEAFFARERIAGLYEGLKMIPEAVGEWLALARSYARFRLFNRSRQRLMRAIKLEPQNLDHRRRLVDLLKAMGLKKDAAKQLEELGKHCEATGDEVGALACYQQSLELNPDDEALEQRIFEMAPQQQATLRWFLPYVALAVFLLALGLGALFAQQQYAMMNEFVAMRSQAIAKAEQNFFDQAREQIAAFQGRHPGYAPERVQAVGDAVGVLEGYAAKQRFQEAVRAEEAGQLKDAISSYGFVQQSFMGTEWATKAGARRRALLDRELEAEEMRDQVIELRNAGAHQQAFELGRELLREYPLTQAVKGELIVPFLIETEPGGAKVEVDGNRIGNTPFTVEHDLRQPFELALSLAEFQDVAKTVDLNDPELGFPLQVKLLRGSRWRLATLGPLLYEPVLARRRVLLAGTDQRIYAISPEGSELWSHQLGPFLEPAGLPRVAGESVLVLDVAGNLKALASRDGLPRWTQQLELEEPELVGTFEGLAIVSGVGVVVGIDAEDGSERWRTPLARHLAAPVRLGRGRVLLAGADGFLEALDATNGRSEFRFRVGGRPVTSPVRTPKGYVIATEEGKLNLVYGKVQWSVPLEGTASSDPVFSPDDGRLYLAVEDRLRCLKLADGSEVWSKDFPAPIARPVFWGGRVYVAATDGHVYSLKAATAEVRWTFKTEGTLASSPVVDRDTVYVAAEDFSLYAIAD